MPIGLAIKHFESSKCEHRTVILLTDEMIRAARFRQEAAEIASQEGGDGPHRSGGRSEGCGEEKMDVEALQAISMATKGSFFRADDRVQLDTIYRKLDEISRRGSSHLLPAEVSAVPVPAGAFLATFLAYHLLMGVISWRYARVSQVPSLRNMIILAKPLTMR